MGTTVVGIGEILWDVLPEGPQLGGAPANFAYHAHALGAEAVPVSSVGTDGLGRALLSRLEEIGVCRDYIAVDPVHATGTVTVAVDGTGKPEYTIREGVAWDNLPCTGALRELAGRTQVVCFGTLAQRSPVTGGTIQCFVDHVPAEGLRIFDINLRQQYYSREAIEASLCLADVLKINDEELPIVGGLFGLSGAEEAVMEALCATYGLDLIALTRGGAGSCLWSRADGASRHPGVPAEVVDTVGAGDAFTAALALGLVAGRSLDAINEHANRLAAHVCSQKGATPPVPEALRAG